MDLPEELSGVTPEQVLAFLRESSDDELRETVHRIGTPVVLGLLFGAMADRFGLRPGRLPGLLVFALDDDGTVHPHGLALTEGGGRHVVSPTDQPRATIRTTLVRFLRVAAGAQDPKRLVLTGRMRLSGDAVWAVTALSGMQQG